MLCSCLTDLHWGNVFLKNDAVIAVQAATQMAEIWGEDVAIMSDLHVKPLREAVGTVLEIVRCPASLKKQDRDVD